MKVMRADRFVVDSVMVGNRRERIDTSHTHTLYFDIIIIIKVVLFIYLSKLNNNNNNDNKTCP